MQVGPGRLHGMMKHEAPPWRKKKHKTNWVAAIIAGVIIGILTMFIGYCIMMRSIS